MKKFLKKMMLVLSLSTIAMANGFCFVSANEGISPFANEGDGGGMLSASISGPRNYSTSTGKGTQFYVYYPSSGSYSKVYLSITNGKFSNSYDNKVYGGTGNYSVSHTSQATRTYYYFTPVTQVAGYVVTGAAYN